MNNNLFMVAIFWGVWIIIPVLFDGILAFIYMLTIIFHKKYQAIFKKPLKNFPICHSERSEESLANASISETSSEILRLTAQDDIEKKMTQLPEVSIIIPTYNEEENINQCLNYLKIQTYPHDKMEIIVVDNGSTDQTSNIVKEQMKEIWQNRNQKTENGEQYGEQKLENGQPISNFQFPNQSPISSNRFPASFGGLLRLVIRYEKGKAKALNTGIKLAQGDIIINIDCRSFLAPTAIYNMVKKFIQEPEYGAITGNVEIDWQLIYNRDQNGNYLLDREGHYQPRELSHKEKFLGKSQFMEYLTSFRLGREFQDITGSMFTFSGAFSAFRRDVLLNSSLYQSRTVAEDTDLTLDLQGFNIRLGFAEEAKAYLKPVISFEKFYAQRIRWHRGQIEVIGLHLDWYANLRKGFWRNLWLGLLLMIDHTFSFPRIIWIFMLPLFFLFGYSMSLIVEAIVIMYGFYVLMDFLNAYYCYKVVDNEAREKIKDSIQYCFVIPFFRLLTFYFRFAGYLETLKEPQAWTTPINPVRSVKVYRSSFKGSYQKVANFSLKIWQFITGHKAEELPVYYDEKIAELDDYGLGKTAVEPEPKVSEGEVVLMGRGAGGTDHSFDYKER